MLVCLHVAATGANHPYFPQVQHDTAKQTKIHIQQRMSANENVAYFFCNLRRTCSQRTICTLLMTPWKALMSLEYVTAMSTAR